jgi:hypothetical protein
LNVGNIILTRKRIKNNENKYIKFYEEKLVKNDFSFSLKVFDIMIERRAIKLCVDLIFEKNIFLTLFLR